jgi:hypothetical protein
VWANARNDLTSTRVWAQAIGPRIVIAKTIPAAGRGLAAALVVVNVLLGLFPLVFVLATSVVVGRVPTAVSAGLDSPEWESLVTAFLLAAAAFVGQQVVSTVQGSLGEDAKLATASWACSAPARLWAPASSACGDGEQGGRRRPPASGRNRHTLNGTCQPLPGGRSSVAA